jgi:hypothetical protein
VIVTGIEVAGRAATGGNEEEVAALVAVEGVPVAIEQMSEDFGLDL